MAYKHAVVWMDHQHATIIGFSADDHHVAKLRLNESRHSHHRSESVPWGHSPEELRFLEEVVAAIGATVEVVVAGPGTAKGAFVRHVEHKHPTLRARILAVETLDHPSDRELLAFARTEFRRIDALLGDAPPG